MVAIVARDEELAAPRAFIAEPREAPRVLVREGELGIGKSTLWLGGVEHARAAGLRILSSRPARWSFGRMEGRGSCPPSA
jgi:hypothetical protein